MRVTSIRQRLRTLTASLVAAASMAGLLAGPAMAEPKKEFEIAWTIYVGWMPWPYAADSGIIKKWADKYGITINVTQINDYVESINQYTAGRFDGVTLTNMDALTIPAVGGVDTTALIVGDFSNGNDGIVSKSAKTVAELKGETINLVELSVSHYLLARALDEAGLSEKDVTVVNTSDADMVAAFKAPDTTTVVTWNPLLAEVKAEPGANALFDSAQIPGEIIDMLAVNTQTLKDNPDFGKALVGAWYETMALVVDPGEAGQKARAAMGALSGTDLAGFDAQLAATKLFPVPADAVAFVSGPDVVTTMENVRSFSFDHGLLGEGAPSADVVGIEFPGGKVLGDTGNVKLRFDPSYMALAADGKL
ncbi:putative urea ABC transporter substrate-binding protein [Methylobrevis pamukkalensis]|uniref:Alkanesulfonate transporter substrate-binding subunit n=1 Tax=Methylobrevis pamukkalensis TaxID=1439726 RepID=A0A1E3GYP2_9HYPH|nr:putative urea ABC transporter substrate-binding protein [Methylobrevis pamukkalensis]ODN69162.1 alkanesulfonate transporter substrate-binding subunit [Methylobrevis pamukkalensis]